MGNIESPRDPFEIQQAGVPVCLAPERLVRSPVQKVRYERIRRHLVREVPAARPDEARRTI